MSLPCGCNGSILGAMPKRWFLAIALAPCAVFGQIPSKTATSGPAPGFVLESWTASDGLPVNTISHVVQSRSGYIWLATFDGLVRFDGARFTTFNMGNSDGLPTNRIVDIVESRDSTLWLTTEDNQHVSFRNGKFTSVANDKTKLIHPSAKLNAQGPDGRKWSALNGNIYVDGQIAYRTPIDAGFAMTITAITVDHEGSLWFGTTAGGLHQLKSAVFRVYTIDERRGENNLYSVAPARTGGVWAGGWQDAVSKIENERMTTFRPDRGVPSGVISILEDSKNRVWLGEVPCELPAMRCRRIPSMPNLGVVRAIYEDRDGTIWFGGGNGLFQLSNGQWTRVSEKRGAPNSLVRAFLKTSDDALWMATNGGGVVRFKDGAFRSITSADGMPSDLIRSLYQDKDDWLWIGTEGKGIARLDPREWGAPRSHGQIINIRSRDGLFDDVIHVILADSSDRLWMSTNRGIFWVPRQELNAFADKRLNRIRSTGYTERHGLRNREANGGSQPAGTRTPDGRLWFATQDGVAVVDPSSISKNTVRPNVVVERVIAGDTALTNTGKPMEIKPQRRDLQVEFTALSFLAPENVRFKYRLAPYDKDWVDADTRRSATYTRVPPGHYTFNVIGSNGEGVWNQQGASIELNIVPRFFETRTFKLLAVLAFLLMVWAGVRWRLARLNSLATELQERVDARTHDLRERETLLADQNIQLTTQAEQLQELDRAKTRFFANVSHELRTPLTLTIGPLEDVRAQLADKGSRDAISRIDMALRNARRLFRLVNQILDVSKLEAGGTKLYARPGDLAEFVRGISAAFIAVAERKGIKFEVNAPGGGDDIWFDPDALEKVLANLLSNAFKFTPDRGGILVSVEAPDGVGFARVRVSDSGPGIPAEHLPHIFDRFYQVDETNTRAQPGTGIGLSLARELAELHGGTIDVESCTGGGATFTLSLPMGRSHLRDDQIAASFTNRSNGASVLEIDAALASVDGEAHSTELSRGSSEDVTTLLVVDDNADLRTYVRERFESRYRIIEAADGADAIRRAREVIPDLVISDVMMPGTDGHAMCAALRESPETDFIPVILLTAQADLEQRIAGLGRGADDYIVKPFDMRELEARVENLITSRRRLRERYSGKHLQLKSSDDKLSAVDKAFVERLRTTIESNLADPAFGVSELAAAVFQDRSHLFRRTRELLNETPSDLLRRLRLERARTLLEDSGANVAEVAYGAGFNSVSHFCRAFRAAYGVTPSAYRATAQPVT
jgi:signal transduction histidine kinase/DNA-binding response OmpR family regulator/ligand-binding sensor domain-containing protein